MGRTTKVLRVQRLAVAGIISWLAAGNLSHGGPGAATPEPTHRLRAVAVDGAPRVGSASTPRYNLPHSATPGFPGTVANAGTTYDILHNASTGRFIAKQNDTIDMVYHLGSGTASSASEVRMIDYVVAAGSTPLLLDDGSTVDHLPLGYVGSPADWFLSSGSNGQVTRFPTLDKWADGRIAIGLHGLDGTFDTSGLYAHTFSLYLRAADLFLSTESFAPKPGGLPDEQFLWPKVSADNLAGQYVMHMATHQRLDGPYFKYPIYYWNATYDTLADAWTWSSETFIDSSITVCAIAEASPVNDDVVIVYTRNRGIDTLQTNNDVCYRLSTNGGVSFQAPVNITSFSESDPERAYADVGALFDTSGTLHIVYNTLHYDTIDGYLFAPVNLYHWSSARPTPRKIACADWEITCQSFSTTNVGSWNLFMSKPNISYKPAGVGPGAGIADDMLYVVWEQYGPTFTDCATIDEGGTPGGYANAELYLCASSDGGLTWDVPLNITGTQTPDCLPGDCLSEHDVTSARYADSGIYLAYYGDTHGGRVVLSEGRESVGQIMAYAPATYPAGTDPRICVTPHRFTHVELSPSAPPTLRPLIIENVGTSTLVYTAFVETTDFGNDHMTINGSPSVTDSIPAGGAPDTLMVALDAVGLTPGDEKEWQIDVTSNDPTLVLDKSIFLDILVVQDLIRVSGYKFLDSDSNCVRDTLNEIGLQSWTLTLNPGGLVAVTDPSGYYEFLPAAPGTYTIAETGQADWSQSCPVGGTYTVTVGSLTDTTGFDFGNYPVASIRDFAVSVSSGNARPGFAYPYYVEVSNEGTEWDSSALALELPAEVNFFSADSSGMYTGGDHTVRWDIGARPPGYNGRYGVIALVPPDTSLLGDTITATATITPYNGEDDPPDNSFIHMQEVRGSVDPNEKLVSPPDTIPDTQVLTYQVGFQNVGTDTAFTVVIYDTLSTDLDTNTLTLVTESHAAVFSRTGHALKWTFNNILLPDSNVNEPLSHGYVVYKIQPVAGVSPGTVIPNRASIVFDFNPALATNSVTSTIEVAACAVALTGDVDVSGALTSADIISLVNFVFKGGAGPMPCDAAGDVDCSGAVTSADIIYMVNHVFKGGPAPCDVCSLIPGTWSCP